MKMLAFVLLFFSSIGHASLEGHLKGIITTFKIPKHDAQALLPPMFTISEDLVLEDEMVPMTVFAGENRISKVNHEKVELEKYHELSVNLFVNRQGIPDKTFSYPVSTLVTTDKAIELGENHGVHKFKALFKILFFIWTFTSETDPLDRKTLYAKIIPGQVSPGDFDRETFKENLKNLSQIQKNIPMISQSGKCALFNWNFETAKTFGKTVSNADFTKEFLKKEFRNLKSPSLDKDLFGTMWIETQWQMSSPLPCQWTK